MNSFLEVGPHFASGIAAFAELAHTDPDNPVIKAVVADLLEQHQAMQQSFDDVAEPRTEEAEELVNDLARSLANTVVVEYDAALVDDCAAEYGFFELYDTLEAASKSGLRAGYFVAKALGVQAPTSEVPHG